MRIKLTREKTTSYKDVENTQKEKEIPFKQELDINLLNLANKHGLYVPLCLPEEISLSKYGKELAVEVIPDLETGQRSLFQDNMNSEQIKLMHFVKHYLKACYDHPGHVIEIER